MSSYNAPIRDMQFVMRELAGLDAVAALPCKKCTPPCATCRQELQNAAVAALPRQEIANRAPGRARKRQPSTSAVNAAETPGAAAMHIALAVGPAGANGAWRPPASSTTIDPAAWSQMRSR